MQCESLPKNARLLKAADFDKVFKKSVRSSDRFFTILARPSDLPYPRLGMAISKRKARLAVTRNRLKRLVRESFRHTHPYSADYVVMAGSHAAHVNNNELVASLEKHWMKLQKKCDDF